MPDRLKNKVAIVTGGSAGIGQATSELFAEEGAKVVVANPHEATGEECVARIRARGGDAIFVRTDISKEEDCRSVCDQAVETFGQLNILVNNGARFIFRDLEATVDEWHEILDVNVIGTALMSRYASKHMRQAGGGAIVNVGSISSFIAQPAFITYSTTKAALVQMTRNMALDLAAFKIRVNCVCPGTILTRASYEHMDKAGQTLEELIAEQAPLHLLKRIGEPREVAYPILFLASDEASFITGTHLMVDGGYTAV